MKRIFIALLLIFILGAGNACSAAVPHDTADKTEEPVNHLTVRAVWLPYYELQQLTQECDEAGFIEAINDAFGELSGWGFTTVTVHVRPCADAFYRSNLFPSSRYCFGEQGSDMPYDPLAVMCDAAHQNSLKIEAWINPYRVSQENDIDALCDDNIAKKWYGEDNTKSRVFLSDHGIYFNPAGDGVTDLIVGGVKEIVESYPVDAIHFDDYFYPTTEESIDRTEYQKYHDNGGEKSLSEYRRQTVSDMIKAVYAAVKGVNEEVQFGISPAADMQADYQSLYADVETWMTEEGYADYIVPQIYFGFHNEAQPFMSTVKKWKNKAKCPLYVGLPLYKSGREDLYASSDNREAINEFVDNQNIIARQITYLSKTDKVQGFYVFSYGCLKNEQYAEEVKNLLQAMQDSSQAQRHNP